MKHGEKYSLEKGRNPRSDFSKELEFPTVSKPDLA